MDSRTTILLTRPEGAARRFAGQLGPCDADVLISPLMRIEPVIDAPMPPDDAVLILTSRHAVEIARNLLAGRQGFVVGNATAGAAEDAGLEVMGIGADAADLASVIAAGGSAQKLVHLRGEHTTETLHRMLISDGIDYQSVILYRQIAQDLSANARRALTGNGRLILPIFSPRSARLLSEKVSGGALRAELILISMSSAVDAAWTGPHPAKRRIASVPTSDAMIQEIRAALADPG